MLHLFDATLRGKSFSTISDLVFLEDIEEQKPEEDRVETKRANRPGMFVTSQQRRKLPIKFTAHIVAYDIEQRAALADKVSEWVGEGGFLTINSRPEQRIFVRPSERPSLGSSLKWNDKITFTLTAYENPFWEDVTAKTLTGNGSLNPGGTYPTAYVSCNITSTAQAAITTITVTCGNTHITLEGLYITNGKTVSIGYTDEGILQITANGKSALANRTPDSSDDLMIPSGVNSQVSVTANASVSRVFSTRGRYW